MSVKFDIYKSPCADESSEMKTYHARVVSGATVSLDELAHEACHNSSVTEGDVRSVMIELTTLLSRHLAKGENVHLDGLGYFQLTLNSPADCNPKTRAEHISVKSVSFRPDKSLKEQLGNITLERSDRKIHSCTMDEADIDRQLAIHFQTQPFITRAQFQRMMNVTTITATRKIKELLEKGKLKNLGTRYHPVYVAGDGCKKE